MTKIKKNYIHKKAFALMMEKLNYVMEYALKINYIAQFMAALLIL